ncbi:hypothetical protein ACR0ST_04280 [Aliidiomarina sp. Khilg15.8]
MNQREYTALFSDSDISHIERTLYMYLRWHMDYASGLVGKSRRISYQGIREHLEYEPARTSTEKAYYPSKPQVNRLLRKLEDRGLIQRVHSSGMKEAMVFRLTLASTDLDRPDEARHKRDTITPTQSATQENTVSTGAKGVQRDTNRDTSATQEPRHTSDTSVKEKKVTRANQSFCHSTDLQFDDFFKATVKETGILKYDFTEHEIQIMFDAFKWHNSSNAQGGVPPMKPITNWRNLWRTWLSNRVVRESQNERRKTTHASSRPVTRAQRHGDIWDDAEQASQRRSGGGGMQGSLDG